MKIATLQSSSIQQCAFVKLLSWSLSPQLRFLDHCQLIRLPVIIKVCLSSILIDRMLSCIKIYLWCWCTTTGSTFVCLCWKLDKTSADVSSPVILELVQNVCLPNLDHYTVFLICNTKHTSRKGLHTENLVWRTLSLISTVNWIRKRWQIPDQQNQKLFSQLLHALLCLLTLLASGRFGPQQQHEF